MRKKYFYFFVLIIFLILNFSEIGVQNVQRKTILDFKDELKLTKEQEERIRELFQLRAEAVIEEIKAGREIDKVLNEAQRERWKEIRRGKK